MIEANFEAELRIIFLDEAEDLLDLAETTLIDLENGLELHTQIGKLFRAIHTIKGSAQIAGLLCLANFAHVFENLLDELRKDHIALSASVIDVLLSGNDAMKAYIGLVRLDPQAKFDGSHHVERIRQVLDKSIPGNVMAMTSANTISDTLDSNCVPQAAFHPNDGDSPNHLYTILLVDDEVNLLSIMSKLLRDEGYNVIAEEAPSNALRVLETSHIDALITDIKMPDMDGIKFVQTLRASKPDLPIAFVSGYCHREHLASFFELTVNSFIEKPFKVEYFLRSISKLVREKKLRNSVLDLIHANFNTYVELQKQIARENSRQEHQDSVLIRKEVIDTYLENIKLATSKVLHFLRD